MLIWVFSKSVGQSQKYFPLVFLLFPLFLFCFLFLPILNENIPIFLLQNCNYLSFYCISPTSFYNNLPLEITYRHHRDYQWVCSMCSMDSNHSYVTDLPCDLDPDTSLFSLISRKYHKSISFTAEQRSFIWYFKAKNSH